MKKRWIATATAALLSLGVLAGCSSVGIASIEKSRTVGLVDYYTITYTDGTTSEFTVTNGKDGKDGSDGQDLSARDVYATYQEIYGDDLTYAEFLDRYFASEVGAASLTSAQAVNSCLRSSLKIHCEFTVQQTTGGLWGGQTVTVPALSSGSAVIYRMDDEYTYLLTNYHVVYNSSAVGSKVSEIIHAYIYGTEASPKTSSDSYVYDDYAIECEYVGGSIACDVAVVRAKTEDILARNPQATAVEIADAYYVGEAVYAIGNTENCGISVNSGVVSMDSEYISLAIDGTARSYRSIRMDASIMEGNSGGGLFDAEGKMIGLNNAGSSSVDSFNYAIPASIVTGVADGILHYASDGDDTTVGTYKLWLGVTVSTQNARFVYDASAGLGHIEEDVVVSSVTEGSIAQTVGVLAGDILTSVTVNGETMAINRDYEIGDLFFTVRAGDRISLTYKRGGAESRSSEYTVASSDLVAVA